MLALGLFTVFAPMECPSTLLCCHAAVKPTSFDTFLSHENPGTDTLLPILFDDSRENSLELPLPMASVCLMAH